MGHVGVWWVMYGWGGSCRGGVGHVGVGGSYRVGGWDIQEWGGLCQGWAGSCRGGMGHVGWGGSCRGGEGGSCRGWVG